MQSFFRIFLFTYNFPNKQISSPSQYSCNCYPLFNPKLMPQALCHIKIQLFCIAGLDEHLAHYRRRFLVVVVVVNPTILFNGTSLVDKPINTSNHDLSNVSISRLEVDLDIANSLLLHCSSIR